MTNPRALVLRAPGINCNRETEFALSRAGARAETRALSQCLADPSVIENAQILVFPGGFSFGDDLGAGRMFALSMRRRLDSSLQTFLERGGLVLGICNGFQALVALGLLPSPERAALVTNQSGHYECRWVRLKSIDEHRCAYLPQGLELELPVAHAEGRLLFESPAVAERLCDEGQTPLRYVDASGEATTDFPDNPNGAPLGIASLCDPTGRIFGLMPHPDRAFLPHHSRGLGALRSGATVDSPGAVIFDGIVSQSRELV
ncbi:MAG: phosphoribosylformylglycinamidine synthase subunit PurQ [Planctomycetota bacterium]